MNQWLIAQGASWEPTAWWLVDLGARATLLFVVAFVVANCLRRASAAARHLVWLAAFVGAGTLPLVSTSVPAWQVAALHPPRTTSRNFADEAPRFASTELESNTFTAGATASTAPWDETLAATHALETEPARSNAPVAPAEVAQPSPWATIIVSVWLTGAALMLLPLVIGALSLARLACRASPCDDARLLAVLQASGNRLNCRRNVRLLISDVRQVPMTWGAFRPIVLLPSTAHTWSDAQLRMVLLHELAHVVRADCAMQWLIQLCRAMYWYHPLAWLAYARLRREQEQACDDRVLNDGFRAPDYADYLVAVAAGLAPRRWTAAVALAMADQSRLERRVMAILSSHVNRQPLSSRAAAAWLVGAAAVVIPVASYTTAPQQAFARPPIDAVVQTFESAVARQAAPADGQSTDASGGALAELQSHVTRRYVTAPDEAMLVRGAMRGMVQALNDPHSEVMSAEDLTQLQRQIEGSLTGIGAQLEMRDGRPAVLTPLENSPALKAGLRSRDVILEVDGQPAGDNLQQVASRIMGPADSTVKLLVERGDGSRATIEIVRAPFKLPSVQGYVRDGDNKWNYVLDAERQIGYLRITQFGADTAAEIRQAMVSVPQPLKGLILDLRFCPGGLMNQAIEVVRIFAPTGEIVTLRGRDGGEQRFGEGDAPNEPTLPLVVLVNEQTASSAEIVSGALQANHCAIVVGTRTHGKASVQELVRLADGTGIRLTTAYYHLPGGRNIHKRAGEAAWGVDPDDGYFVPMSASQSERFLQDLRERERIVMRAAGVAEETPSALNLNNAALHQRDPQLAAAWQAMAHRLDKGRFQATGRSLAELRTYVAERELAAKRSELVGKLEEVSQELRELDAKIGEAP